MRYVVIWRRALPAIIALATVLIGCRKVITWLIDGGVGRVSGPNTYNYAILAANYFNSGFVRRGLGGTIMIVFDNGDQAASLARFHIFCAVFLAIPLSLLLQRLAAAGGRRHIAALGDQLQSAAGNGRQRFTSMGGRQWLWLSLVVAASPQLFLSWSTIVGKGDMLNVGFIIWALLAALDRRFIVAMAVLAVGSLAHETVLFFGTPLVVTIWYVEYRAAKTSLPNNGARETLRRGVGQVAFLATLLAGIAVAQHVFGPTQAEMARVTIDGLPADFERDLAAYMTAGGFRTLTTAACLSFHRPAVYLNFATCLVVLASYPIVLVVQTRAVLLTLAFTTLLPGAALSIIAIDYGRWLSLAVMTAWLTVVALQLKNPEPEASQRRYVLAAIVLASLVAMGPSSIFFANRASERLAAKFWPESAEGLEPYLDGCDPTWRAVITPH